LMVFVQAGIIEWDELADAAVKGGLFEDAKDFNLDTDVLAKLVYAINVPESGEHDRSIIDEIRTFKCKVKKHLTSTCPGTSVQCIM